MGSDSDKNEVFPYSVFETLVELLLFAACMPTKEQALQAAAAHSYISCPCSLRQSKSQKVA